MKTESEMETLEPVRLVTKKSDREIAEDLRKRMEMALEPVLELWEEASKLQLMSGFRFERDAFGRGRIVVTLHKEF
jgi:hypothetical protein